MDRPSTLDCQECGATLRVLSLAEAQRVAANPYNYVAYCRPCARAVERQIERESRW